MANYDDIFNASAQKDTEDKSFVSFDKDAWAAQKKQERESAFAMIDETAQRMANDGSLFQSYLDVQARFDRYSVGNAVLITAQKADATQLSDFKGWKNNGVFIKKGESGIVLLEPGEEYTKEDGTVGVSYNSKKVFDIAITRSCISAAMMIFSGLPQTSLRTQRPKVRRHRTRSGIRRRRCCSRPLSAISIMRLRPMSRTSPWSWR